MRTIRYIQKIRKRGPFGIPYTGFKLRTAHVDEARWHRMKRRPFSMGELMAV